MPPAEVLQGERASDSGMILIGEKGSIFTPSDYGIEQLVLPRDKFADFPRPTPTLERLGGDENRDANQKREWIRAIQGGPAPTSNFDYASVLTESMLLGNLAVRLGQALEYDGDAGSITNCPSAAPYYRRSYREGWQL